MTIAVTPLPAPPARADSANFATRGDAFLAALILLQSEVNAQNLENNSLNQGAFTSASAAQADRILCAAAQAVVTAQSPVTNAANAAASAALAAAFASTAQAANPDSPIRLNPRFITNNFSIPASSNAVSIGPITISDGITVTVANSATYAIQ